MRAICDSCAKPQPLDWRGGDHCVWCGEAVRREVRCFWCANWTPAVKFCRTCGAATVDANVYGAARMLKDAGCDRFTVPRQLAELEPDQIENFTRIYQEHAAVAAHHVEQVEFLEQFLQQKHWSAALDDSLAPELPWPLEQLANADAGRGQADSDAGRKGAPESAGDRQGFAVPYDADAFHHRSRGARGLDRARRGCRIHRQFRRSVADGSGAGAIATGAYCTVRACRRRGAKCWKNCAAVPCDPRPRSAWLCWESPRVRRCPPAFLPPRWPMTMAISWPLRLVSRETT